MRLIRRPWKGCQFWDVPFTIPWKGCKFQKWGLRKRGHRICFFWIFNMLHMLSYDHQGVGVGVGVGRCINVLDEHFLYVTADAHVAHAVVWSSGGVQALAFSLQMEPEVLQPVVTKITPTKGSRWRKSTTKKISLLRLIVFQVVCGVNPIEPLLLVLNCCWYSTNGWNTETLKKMATPVDAPQKIQNVHKKVRLGLQRDMASQRCLVADCGFCFATSALAPLSSRRGRNWKSECRPEMIRMIENHRF